MRSSACVVAATRWFSGAHAKAEEGAGRSAGRRPSQKKSRHDGLSLAEPDQWADHSPPWRRPFRESRLQLCTTGVLAPAAVTPASPLQERPTRWDAGCTRRTPSGVQFPVPRPPQGGSVRLINRYVLIYDAIHSSRDCSYSVHPSPDMNTWWRRDLHPSGCFRGSDEPPAVTACIHLSSSAKSAEADAVIAPHAA